MPSKRMPFGGEYRWEIERVGRCSVGVYRMQGLRNELFEASKRVRLEVTLRGARWILGLGVGGWVRA